MNVSISRLQRITVNQLKMLSRSTLFPAEIAGWKIKRGENEGKNFLLKTGATYFCRWLFLYQLNFWVKNYIDTRYCYKTGSGLHTMISTVVLGETDCTQIILPNSNFFTKSLRSKTILNPGKMLKQAFSTRISKLAHQILNSFLHNLTLGNTTCDAFMN